MPSSFLDQFRERPPGVDDDEIRPSGSFLDRFRERPSAQPDLSSLNRRAAISGAADIPQGVELPPPPEQFADLSSPNRRAAISGAADVPQGVELPPPEQGDPFNPYRAAMQLGHYAYRLAGDKSERARLKKALDGNFPMVDNLLDVPDKQKRLQDALKRNVPAMMQTLGGAAQYVAHSGPGAAIPPARDVLQQAGEYLSNKGEQLGEKIPTDPRSVERQLFEDPLTTVASLTAENLWSMAAVLGSMAGGGAPTALAVAGLLEVGGEYNEAVKNGASPEQAQLSAGITGLANASLEMLVPSRLLKPIGKAARPAFKAAWRGLLETAMLEGVTETLQQANQLLSEFATYVGDGKVGADDLKAIASDPQLRGQLLASFVGGAGMGFVAGGARAGAEMAVGFRPVEALPSEPEPAARVPEDARTTADPPVTNAPWMSETPSEPAPPREAMSHAGSGASPEAAAREAGGTRFYQVSPDGSVLPMVGQDAVDAPARTGFAKVRVSPDGSTTVESGRLTPGAQVGLRRFLSERPPVATREATAPETVELDLDTANDEAFLAEMGVGRPTETEPAPPVSGNPRRTVGYMPDGSPEEMEFDIVEARDVVPSHDINLDEVQEYNQRLGHQPRERARVATVFQLKKMEGDKFNPALLGDAAHIQEGSSIVNSQNAIESGNARHIAVLRHYRDQGGERYKQWLRDYAPRHGLDPGEVDRMDMPVLVRRRLGGMDPKQFAAEANTPITAEMSEGERAMVDIDRLEPSDLDLIDPSKSLDAAANRPFVRAFLSHIPATEVGPLIRGDGTLSTLGQRRVRFAVLAKAFPDPDLISKMSESDADGIKNAGKALLAAAPGLAKTKERIAAGKLDPSLDLSPHLATAAAKLVDLRRGGKRAAVATYLSTDQMFGREMADEPLAMLRAMHEYRRAPAGLITKLKNFNRLVNAVDDKSQIDLFQAPQPTALELFDRAKDYREGELLEGLDPTAEGGFLDIGDALEDAENAIGYWLKPEGNLPKVAWRLRLQKNHNFSAHEAEVKFRLRELDKVIKRYKGVLTRRQLSRYLGDALAGLVAAPTPPGAETRSFDETQIQRVARKGGLPVENVRTRFEELRQREPTKGGILIPREVAAPLGELRAAIDGFTRALRREGKRPLDDARARQLERSEGLYTHRTYEAFRKPGKGFLRKAKRDPLWKRAKELVMSRYGWDEARAEGELSKFVHRDEKPVLPGGVPDGAKNRSVLFKRKRLEDWQRLLLGERRDIRSRYADTILGQVSYLENQRFLEGLRKVGLGVFLTKNPEGRFYRPLDEVVTPLLVERARNPLTDKGTEQDLIFRKKGHERTSPVSGLHTTPEIERELIEALPSPREMGLIMKVWSLGNLATKLNLTAFSPQTQGRNFESGVFPALTNGYLPFTKEGMEALSMIVRDLGGSSAAEVREYAVKHRELGIMDQSADYGDLRRLSRFADALRTEDPTNIPAKLFGTTFRKALQAYAHGDNFWKLTGYYIEKARLEKAFPDAPQSQIEQAAAAKVKAALQNYSELPRFAQKLSANPVFAPFFSFTWAMFRGLKNTTMLAARELRSKNPEVRKIGAKRAVGLAVGLALPEALAGSMFWLSNSDDEDEKALREFVAPWDRGATLGITSRKPGEYTYFNWGFMDYFSKAKEPIRLLHEAITTDRTLGDLSKEFLNDYGTEVLLGAVAEAYWGETRSGRTIWLENDSAATKLEKGMEHILKTTQPGAMRSAFNISDAARGKVSRTGYRRRLMTELLALAGPRIVTIKVRQYLTVHYAPKFNRELRLATRQYSGLAQSRGTVDPDKLVESYERANRERYKAIRDLRRKIDAALASDLTIDEVKKALKGVPKKYIEMAMAGRIDPIDFERGDHWQDAADELQEVADDFEAKAFPQ